MNPEEVRQKIAEEKQNTPSLLNPQVVFAWKAPLRAYKRSSNGVLRFYIALALLLSLIVFFFGEKILILPIGATLFLVYVLTITPPPIVENRITKFGIDTPVGTYRWEYLSHFYFTKKFDYHQVVIVSRPPYYQHVYLILKTEADKAKVLELLSEHLVYLQEPHKTFADRLTDWLTKLMPDVEYQHEESIAQQSVPLGPVEQPL